MPLVLLHSLHFPISSSSSSHQPIDTSKPNSNSYFLRFRVSHRQKLQYLQSLGIVACPKPAPAPRSSPASVDRALAVVHFLKSKGFSDSHFRRLSFLCPSIFSSPADVVDRTLAPVFAFLADDLSATADQSVHLVLRCPNLLLADPDLRLRPTLRFLRELGIKHNLASPTNLSAHLLNTPVDKLAARIRFLEGVGLSHEDAAGICARFPAIFGYSVENNMRPKVEYLVRAMGGSVEELKAFPQFFGFSLEKKIRPRHLHLEARGVRVPLQRLLLWGDEKFYAKWK